MDDKVELERGYIVKKDAKNNRKVLYVRFFIVSILIFGALLSWPRSDLVVMIWACAVLFFINHQLDEQLEDQPQVVSQISQPEVDNSFYYKQPLNVEKNNYSIFVPLMMWLFFTMLPRKAEPWGLLSFGISATILCTLLLRYFYLKYFDAVKDDTLTKHTRKKSRHFLHFDEMVLKEVKGRKQWQIQLDQITAIDLGVFEVWIFYRDQGQIKQHSIHLLQWERLPELRQKLRAIEQRLQLAKA